MHTLLVTNQPWLTTIWSPQHNISTYVCNMCLHEHQHDCMTRNNKRRFLLVVRFLLGVPTTNDMWLGEWYFSVPTYLRTYVLFMHFLQVGALKEWKLTWHCLLFYISSGCSQHEHLDCTLRHAHNPPLRHTSTCAVSTCAYTGVLGLWWMLTWETSNW